jgi:hypothetical protein
MLCCPFTILMVLFLAQKFLILMKYIFLTLMLFCVHKAFFMLVMLCLRNPCLTLGHKDLSLFLQRLL